MDGKTLNCTRLWGLSSGAQRLEGECHHLLANAVLGSKVQYPISIPYQGYDMTPPLPCGLPVLGKAREVNLNIKSGAGVPKVVCKIMRLRQLLRRCWCPSSVDSRRSLASPGHVERENLLPGNNSSSIHLAQPLCSSTGEDTPALLHRLMYTEGCPRLVGR